MKQLLRYAIVGIAHNLAGYCIYLLLTWLGVNPKLVVSIFYPIGAIGSFYANRQWTFSHDGKITSSFFRFVIAHVCGYGLNISMLHLLSDVLGYPHQLVQAAAIFVVAGFLFVTMRFFVFPDKYAKGTLP